ncbi:MAG: segregation/condensation protein A [Clostridia bacterium]|nr:segregation/condensation protein A [Clostridia bacterium]
MEEKQLQEQIDSSDEIITLGELEYTINEWRGPLSVLLTLVTKNKMDIRDIQISVLCDQYLEYINAMEAMDIELAAEFIVMATHLMYIKSKTLIPRPPEDEEDPREALARALMLQMEYERAKEASKELSEMFSHFNGRFAKDTDEIPADHSYVAEHDVNLLSLAIMRVMSAMRHDDESTIASERIKPLISKRTVSVNERVYHILRKLLDRSGLINAVDCFDDVTTRHELVATFMAILEMLKAGRISVIEDVDSVQLDGVVNLSDNVYIRLYTGKIRNAQED